MNITKKFSRILPVALAALLTVSVGIGAAAHKPAPQKAQKTAGAVLPAHKHTANCEKTAAEPVQIICILDRSGSMSPVADDTIGGYNSFLAKQKKEPGRAQVTTVLFDDQYEKITDGTDLRKVEELTAATYYARGNTALLDAVGKTVTETAGKMEKEGICPAKRRVLFLIMTDGQENASREYNKETVKAMIKEATDNYKWNFVFMGANIDSVKEASNLGISPKHAANFAHNKKGVARSFEQMDAAAADVRQKGTVSDNWNK